MGVSKNNGTSKSSVLIVVSIIFTIHFGGKIPLFLGWHPYTFFPKPSSLTARVTGQISGQAHTIEGMFFIPQLPTNFQTPPSQQNKQTWGIMIMWVILKKACGMFSCSQKYSELCDMETLKRTQKSRTCDQEITCSKWYVLDILAILQKWMLHQLYIWAEQQKSWQQVGGSNPLDDDFFCQTFKHPRKLTAGGPQIDGPWKRWLLSTMAIATVRFEQLRQLVKRHKKEACVWCPRQVQIHSLQRKVVRSILIHLD